MKLTILGRIGRVLTGRCYPVAKERSTRTYTHGCSARDQQLCDAMEMSLRRRTLIALSAFFAGGAALVAWGEGSIAGTRIDLHIQSALAASPGSQVWEHAFFVNDQLKTVAVAGTAVGCLLAVFSGGLRRCLAVAVAVLIAGGAAELIKRLSLVRPSPRLVMETGGTWPSAHIAALTALAISVCALPHTSRIRRWVVMGVVIATSLSCLSILLTQAHRPSDVVGGALIGASTWAAVTAAMPKGRESLPVAAPSPGEGRSRRLANPVED